MLNLTHWEIGPIFRALMRNKTGAILIAIQIAVTMTIIVNAIFIISERQKLMARDSGVDEANSFYLSSSSFGEDFNTEVTAAEDLAMIRQTPGVIDAMQINAIPMSGGGWSMSLQTKAGDDIDGTGAAVYMVDEHFLKTLDVDVIAGEPFTLTDIRLRKGSSTDWPDKTIITKSMAETLYPDEPWHSVVGKTVYINNNEPMIITGIIDQLQAPWIGWDGVERVMLSPERLEFTSYRYFIRTEVGKRDELMPQIEEMLANSNKKRLIRDVRSMQETRERSYRQHSAMITILGTVMIVLTVVTGLGIVGLASFSVNRRKKQIGTRRALGASQQAILRYFMLENFIISSAGVVLGAVLTVGLNIWLVKAFELNTLDWYLVPAGMVSLWIVGQLAVFGPAKRAAAIPPALATRTV
ncbi:ABC transporter permease [Alteromonadaceae bacterium BrNp21-10]|nr:ABC transporter permease [Alteromonadaceae bacterium BrNp21-10]